MTHQEFTRILAVDDVESDLGALTSILELPANTSVLTATSGHQAIDMFKQAKIGVVILDQNMKMSGAETLKELRKIDPNVKAVFHSVVGRHAIENALGDTKAEVYIDKPITSDSLTRLNLATSFLLYARQMEYFAENLDGFNLASSDTKVMLHKIYSQIDRPFPKDQIGGSQETEVEQVLFNLEGTVKHFDERNAFVILTDASGNQWQELMPRRVLENRDVKIGERFTLSSVDTGFEIVTRINPDFQLLKLEDISDDEVLDDGMEY